MGKPKSAPQVQMATYDPNGPLTFWKRLEYSSGDGGYHFIYNWINVFLTVFCTDTLGVPAVAVSSIWRIVLVHAGGVIVLGSSAVRCPLACW